MKHIARLVAFVLLSAAVSPAFAADPTYPRGIRVGMTPMDGLVPASTFVGFESPDNGVKVLLAELPAKAFAEVEEASKAAPADAGAVKPQSIATAAGPGYYSAEDGKAGPDKVRRYSLIVSGGKTFSGYVAVQIADSETKTYSEDAVKRMFATVAVRQQVPVAEQLALMPFKVSELSGFKTVRTLAPGAALLLADGDDETGVEAAPFIVLGLIGSAPERSEDRGRFAQQSAGLIPGLREGRITMSEPVRIDGAPGYETRIDAVSGKDNTPVRVVQWLRFGGGNVAIRIIASSPRDQWSKAFPRFRAVRDGLEPR
ncbi:MULTISPECIES: hypothetical protein [Rhodopseudomonas]|uniref:Signal peptide protein n=1 Tax=Rhodopseudomonas palustris TaxID=1076 RepID=A0A0D7EC18_RHOPL|nr:MULTISPECIES: hypothetical protein [Rhodopseudomonas]KIZ38379.1 signal peptide protein [Rhodopseudomonas palustris]MDF3810587.1 hypothetical protein [Rhodopseudomonas sp. BAL398]WOK16489.1 hypothetical protein RBJ75_20360 [Rhodopseudomonas sp. BAL398]